MRLAREYPNINGWPVSPFELDKLPESSLNPEVQNNFNNHHSMWTERAFSIHSLSLVVRNLNAYQNVLPKDIHSIIHDRYDPAPMPDIVDMMDRVDEAFQNRELLRYGSALHPIYRVIDMRMYRSIQQTYNQLNPDKKETILL